MHFSLQDLVLLETIDQTGSFSAASENLYRTRSAIAQHVKKLEDQVGFQIFDRTSYRVTLTEEGRHFLERARPLLRNFEQLKSEIQHIKQGWDREFTIALDDIIPVQNIYFLLEEFRKIAPQVTLRIGREVMNGCWDALMQNRANLVIGASGEPPLDLICQQMALGTMEFVFAVPQGHPLVRMPQPLEPKDLQEFPVIMISDTSVSIEKKTSSLLFSQTRLIVPTMDDKIKAQLQGLGVGNLPRPRIQHLLDDGSFVELQVAGQQLRKFPLKIAWKATSPSPALAWFLKALEAQSVCEQVLGKGAFSH